MNQPQTNPSTIKRAKDMVNDLQVQLAAFQIHLEKGQSELDDMMKKKEEVMKLLNIPQDKNKSIGNKVKSNVSYADVVKSKAKTELSSSDQLRINHRPSNGMGYLVTEEEMITERSKDNARKRKVRNSGHPGKKKKRLNGNYSKIDIDLSKDDDE